MANYRAIAATERSTRGASFGFATRVIIRPLGSTIVLYQIARFESPMQEGSRSNSFRSR